MQPVVVSLARLSGGHQSVGELGAIILSLHKTDGLLALLSCHNLPHCCLFCNRCFSSAKSSPTNVEPLESALTCAR